MSKFDVMGKSILSEQKVFPIYPDVSPFGARLVMADGRPTFLLDQPLGPENKNALELAGWTVDYDRLFSWKEPTISMGVLKQLFPLFEKGNIRREVIVDFVKRETLIDALDDSFGETTDASAEEQASLNANDVANQQQENEGEGESQSQGQDRNEATSPAPQAKAKKIISDAGKKIGGAKKDRNRHLASINGARDEIFTMSQIEISKEIKKRSIWNFSALDEIQGGMSVKKALFIREIISAFPSWNGSVQLKLAARENPAQRNVRRSSEDVLSMLRKSASFYAESLLALKNALVDRDVEFEDLAFVAESALQELLKNNSIMTDITSDDDLIAKSAALICDSRVKRNGIGGFKFNDYQIQKIIDSAIRSSRNDDDWALDRSEYILKHDVEKEKSTPRPIDTTYERPHLTHIKRSGLPEIRNGEDVTPEDFINTFGFRAVEFGNWLPNDERQDVLNKAYDAFYTLSLATGIEVGDIGLVGIYSDENGDPQGMALAFGARGSGGRRAAAAHWEPGRCVMNLTRMSGAGATAHEYGHALDQFNAKIADRAGYTSRSSGKNGYFLTGRMATSSAIWPCPTVNKDRALDQNQSLILQRVLSAAYDISEGFIFSPLLRNIHNESRVELLTKHKQSAIAIIADMASGDLREKVLTGMPLNLGEFSAAEKQALNDVIAAFPSDRSPLSTLLAHSAMYIIKDDAINDSNNELSRRPSLYSRMAKQADLERSRSSKYFVSQHEMFARGFESFVQDKLKAMASDGMGRDDYLVYDTDRAGNIWYPISHEREAYKEMFTTYCNAVSGYIDTFRCENPRALSLPGM